MIPGESNHWICTSCCGDGIVRVMDSLGSFMALNRTTVLQITKIYSVPPSRHHLRLMKLSSATTFSIAFALEACLGKSPEVACFNHETNEETLVSVFGSWSNVSFSPERRTTFSRTSTSHLSSTEHSSLLSLSYARYFQLEYDSL